MDQTLSFASHIGSVQSLLTTHYSRVSNKNDDRADDREDADHGERDDDERERGDQPSAPLVSVPSSMQIASVSEKRNGISLTRCALLPAARTSALSVQDSALAVAIAQDDQHLGRRLCIDLDVVDQFSGIFVDHGLLRKDEPEQVVTTFRDTFQVSEKA